jgi:hypothetical protein
MLAPRPCRLHDRRPLKPRYLIARADFAKKIEPSRLIRNTLQGLFVALGNVANRLQPVIDDTMTLPIKRGTDSAAAIVPANYDVRDLENLNGIFEDGQEVEVAWVHQVGHIAMHEHLSRFQAGYYVCGNPAVRTTDPQILRPLKVRKPVKIAGIVTPTFLGPPAIVIQQVIEHMITHAGPPFVDAAPRQNVSVAFFGRLACLMRDQSCFWIVCDILTA